MFIYLFVLLSEGSGWLGQEGFFHGISELMGTALRNSRKSLGRIFNGIPRPRITHSYINGEPHFVPVATDSWSLTGIRTQPISLLDAKEPLSASVLTTTETLR